MPVVVTGYRELLQACNRADKDTKKYVTDALAGTGEAVRSDAAVCFGTDGGRPAPPPASNPPPA